MTANPVGLSTRRTSRSARSSCHGKRCSTTSNIVTRSNEPEANGSAVASANVTWTLPDSLGPRGTGAVHLSLTLPGEANHDLLGVLRGGHRLGPVRDVAHYLRAKARNAVPRSSRPSKSLSQAKSTPNSRVLGADRATRASTPCWPLTAPALARPGR